MLKLLMGAAVVAAIAFSFLDSSKQPERTAQQAALLESLEALNHPQASKLVDEWRTAYPEPNDERLTELRVLVQRVKADPASAEQFTAAAKQKKLDALPFESPLTGTPKAKPGLGL
ncbi:hypothetical protein ACQVRV_00405 (plasmid) [Ralstonia pseudosolanacearum]